LVSGAVRIELPDVPALAVGVTRATLLDSDGSFQTLPVEAAARRLDPDRPPLLCHARLAARRLGRPALPAHDLLELFAFVRPGAFCLPSIRGLTDALGLARPRDLEDEARALPAAALALLEELARQRATPAGRHAARTARAMAAGPWPWAPFVLAAFGEPPEAGRPDESGRVPGAGLEVWRVLAEWSDHAPPPAPGHWPVEPAEARRRLSELLGSNAEARPQQADYASAVAAAFAPREREGEPLVVLAEAGTGVGKTLGYLAPGSVWAEKNEGTVWVSTYTRNLQHQIDQELDRRYPDALTKARKVVLRKGRENYLCLLNMEEAVRAVSARPADVVALGLMARWAAASRDGDMVGGDFPAWLAGLVGRGRTIGLTDRRGECIRAACPHYQKCFIEKSVRRARRAEIVIANHALVMIQAAMADADQPDLPTRYVFDEGHHVFDAADNAFAARLTGQEMIELRRWLIGHESTRSSRMRGLKRRIEDLLVDDTSGSAALDAITQAARALPGDGWGQRVLEESPTGPAEAFLTLVRRQVRARAAEGSGTLETEVRPAADGLIAAGAALEQALARLSEPMKRLAGRLLERLDDEAADLDSASRLRLESAARGLQRRALGMVDAWRGMCRALAEPTPPEFVDWLAIDRLGERELDVGMHRRWIDPTVPFVEAVAKRAHGLVVTSATLRDGSGDVEADWLGAEAVTGARHLPAPAIRAEVPSPFDYARQTRVFVVTDLARQDTDLAASAYRELFLAAGGGALGLFTAISRLRQVHGRIAPALEQAGLALYAQHVDDLDTATLIDMFRAEEDACLLGTDAVRDGVDVPGRSLRLIVFDKVPWPRPDILHKARRRAFGGAAYDDRITRLRLRQAFGRLVRRADDRGVFVLLDRQMPSRLTGAFPGGVKVERIGLADAVRATREFLGQPSPK
jgi:ATP-dependent DNA helicase DinG